jgi:hypothetical protein
MARDVIERHASAVAGSGVQGTAPGMQSKHSAAAKFIYQ